MIHIWWVLISRPTLLLRKWWTKRTKIRRSGPRCRLWTLWGLGNSAAIGLLRSMLSRFGIWRRLKLILANKLSRDWTTHPIYKISIKYVCIIWKVNKELRMKCRSLGIGPSVFFVVSILFGNVQHIASYFSHTCFIIFLVLFLTIPSFIGGLFPQIIQSLSILSHFIQPSSPVLFVKLELGFVFLLVHRIIWF